MDTIGVNWCIENAASIYQSNPYEDLYGFSTESPNISQGSY